MLNIKNLTTGYNKAITKDINISLPDNGIIAVLGPNGSGKTTFLKTLLGALKPLKGNVYIHGKKLSKMSRLEISRNISYVPQSSNILYNYTVRDFITWAGFGKKLSFKEIKEQLQKANITSILKRGIKDLSGGEKQIVYTLRAFIQPTRIVLADEPVAHLDWKHINLIMNMFAEASYKRLIVFAVHDINLAISHAKQVIVFNNSTYTFGKTLKILTPEYIKQVWGILPLSIQHPEKNIPQYLLP